MRLSWILLILLLVFVAVFSVQNADPITVRFLGWEVTMSAALVIQLAALMGALVGLTVGAWSRQDRKPAPPADPAEKPIPALESPRPPEEAPSAHRPP